jgi:uncharacterized protein (TIGR01319 family)
MTAALLIDFGSTWTKLRALDVESGALIGTAQGPSTVATDVNVGLDAALAALARTMNGLPSFACRLASSSAAGGLRMATVGLVRELTAEAARQAALGAGARLVGSFAYRLTARDIANVEALAPDILLLCGGTDGGNADVILHNAHALARSGMRCPFVVAGNRETTDEIVALLAASGRVAIPAANVLPALDTLDIEPARAAIRDVFMQRIVHAKGIDRAPIDCVLMPTPAAVLEGARLLSQGTGGRDGLGPLVVVDPGGATTDVHSIGAGGPSAPGVIRHGLPEPHAKRTVEADLGVRHNAAAVVEAVGMDALAAEAGVAHADAATTLTRFGTNVEALPATEREARIDQALVRAAVDIAMERHAGTVETVYTAHGPVQVQRGKDLSASAWLIGTGGAIVHARDPAHILRVACADARRPHQLRPHAPRLAVDADYLLYAAGLLAQVDEGAAFDCMRRQLRVVG